MVEAPFALQSSRDPPERVECLSQGVLSGSVSHPIAPSPSLSFVQSSTISFSLSLSPPPPGSRTHTTCPVFPSEQSLKDRGLFPRPLIVFPRSPRWHRLHRTCPRWRQIGPKTHFLLSMLDCGRIVHAAVMPARVCIGDWGFFFVVVVF